MNNNAIIRVLIVEDFYAMRVGLSTVLEVEDDIECKAVDSFDSAINVFKDFQPHIVLVDIKLRDRDGIDLIHVLCDLDADIKIIAISAYLEINGRDTVRDAIKAGARGFLVKDYSIGEQELPKSIRKVFAGESIFSSPVVAKFIENMKRSGEHDNLTPREIDILKLLEKGLTNKRIGLSLNITEHTVKFHVKNIMSKLNAGSRQEAVFKAREMNLL